jgi:Bacterial Ig domain
MLRFGRIVVALAAVFAVAAPAAHAADCSTTVSSTAAAASAVGAAAPGSTVCLADGTYGRLTLNATKAPPGVTVRAEHPGQATIAGAALSGSYLTLAQLDVTDEIQLMPGSTGMTVSHNRISGGYFGVSEPTSSTQVNDASIVGNRFVGPFGEDAIRANRYHDGPDADPYGLLVEGNEITGVRENGNHSDCLQAVWVGDGLYFRRNYLHDNRCQGFFIKDQASTVSNVVADDNLFLRNNAPCDGDPTCGQPSIFQLFGPMTGLLVRRNTIWTPGGGSPTTLRDPGWGTVTIDANVIYRPWSDTTAPFGSSYSATNNEAGTRPEGTWPATGFPVVASPAFADPAHDDYRTNDGRGVDWAPANQTYGPDEAASTPPTDTTAPHTTITSPPALVSLEASATIAFAVDDATATSQCRLDDGGWTPCTSPYAVSGLDLGAHTVRIRSTDTFGNVESPGATASWTVMALPSSDPADTSPPPADAEDPAADAAPTVDLTSPTAGATTARELKLAARARDDNGIDHVEFWVDKTRVARDTKAPYTARYDARAMRAGTHKVTVRAYDTAGQLATDSVTVRVKTTKARAHSAASSRSRSA